MTRRTEFDATVRQGGRVAKTDIVVHTSRTSDNSSGGPRVGLVVSKAVGNSVRRHQVSRRLRHIAAQLISELEPADRVVIRALPSSAHTDSATLEKQLRGALRRESRRVSGT